MLLKIFTLPFDTQNYRFVTAEFDVFCKTHKIIRQIPHLIYAETKPCWTIAVEYDETVFQSKKNRRTEALPEQPTEPETELYSALKAWRNQLAQTNGIPPFIIATNAQLRQIEAIMPKNLTDLEQVPQFGTKKIQKYGSFMLEIVKNTPNHG